MVNKMKIAILADVHSNIVALTGVMKDIKRQACHKIFVLGDMIGYYYKPSEVIDTFMGDADCFVIRGNHEELFLESLSSEKLALDYHNNYGNGLRFCTETLSEAQILWLRSLPSSLEVELDGLKIGLYHGSDKSIDEYIYPDTISGRIDKFERKYDHIFLGHTHYPVVFNHKGSLIINPGSVGQPRDIGSLASYAILNTVNGAVTFRRVEFDSEGLCDEVKKVDPMHPYLHEIMRRNR